MAASSSAPAMARSDRKSTRLNSSHSSISYAVFCLKKKTDSAWLLQSTRHDTEPQRNLRILELVDRLLIASPVGLMHELPLPSLSSLFFFYNDTATTEIYTLSLHDALPIFLSQGSSRSGPAARISL